jgi:hypothetical protein
MVNLWSDFIGNESRSAAKWKHYFPIYESHFGRYINRPLVMIEIGCGEGGSLRMWKRYFGPHAQIVGIDVRPECKAFEEDQIAVRIGSQADEGFLAAVLKEFGTPDIVLDDGSHQMSHVNATFGFLYHKTDPRGVYAVEDMHTSYFPNYGGGLRREGTFIELCKELIDELNAATGNTKVTEFTHSTLSMHFSDSVVVFERGRMTHRHVITPGGALWTSSPPTTPKE